MSTSAVVTVDTSHPQVVVYTRRVESWNAVQKELGCFGESWLFRGQCDAAWGLRCNLDRNRGSADSVVAESLVREAFTQRAHLFMSGAREPETVLEWLALIQHHGGPTRLMDFTRAPLLAAFFALEADSSADTAAVWAIDELACHQRAVKRLRSVDGEFHWLMDHHNIEGAVNARLVAWPPQRFVAPVQPPRLNARMALQQGVFLCLGDPGTDVFENLSDDVGEERPLRVVKLEFPRLARGDALWALRRINISRETLFPGLDGLAQSLAHLLVQRNLERSAILTALDRPAGWPGPS